jgi:hypothetical protein
LKKPGLRDTKATALDAKIQLTKELMEAKTMIMERLRKCSKFSNRLNFTKLLSR